MDLKSFIAETLQQIIAGVAEAQAADGGSAINAQGFGAEKGNLMSNASRGMFTCVDFDVAISAEGSVGGKAKLLVFSLGAEGGGEHKTGYENRIKFSVPIRLPDGAPAEKAKPLKYPDRGII